MKNSPANKTDLSPFFEPRSMAVIGSIGRSGAWFGGRVLMKNARACGYSGEIYLVNPSYGEVDGMPVHPSVKDVPGVVDLAVIMTHARVVPLVLGECAEKGIKSAIVVADGFREAGEEGERLQNEVKEIAERSGIRIIGPNTLGVMDTDSGLMTNPFIGIGAVEKGDIAIGSQTGVIGPQALPYRDWGCRISKICDFGNKCDVDETDLVEYLADDAQTEVIALHLEDIRDGQRFIKTVKKAARSKPILVLKTGRSREGARAVVSHTGSLAGEEVIYDSAFKQAGIIRVDTLNELLGFAKAFSYQPLPEGNRLGIVTPTGGMGVAAIDTSVECGLTVPEPSHETNKKLAEIHPMLGGNPCDIDPAANALGYFPYTETIEALLNDENVDCLVSGCWTHIPADFYIKALDEIKKPERKPITFWLYGPSIIETDRLRTELENHGYPAYIDIEDAVRVLGAMYRYSKIKERLQGEVG